MTVASLWKVLDNAGCGVAIGTQDLMNLNRSKQDLTNPWNYNDGNQPLSASKRPSLAVDLSIWVCEGLTSPGMTQQHSNPALHLAYTRSMKLLSLGIKLVIVVEGKRRVMRTEEPDKFHKRRSGTAFWKSCKACEEMFEAMGVPVVKAKAEGEALCALLNQRGIVDGVISNDGDCLLFGAKVVYTKFSIENLNNSQVYRYDSSDLSALVENESDEKRDAIDDGKISLSRHDLISFALLTGSDLAGNGLPKVGHKKAARFIFKCKYDHPLSRDTAAIDELRSWAQTATVVHATFCEEVGDKEKERCCSVCNHPGDKRSHLKNGCETCGTPPGESCFQFTVSDRFRRGLREKALALQPKFAPTMVVNAYLKPNDNQIPMLLEGITSRTLTMTMPSLGTFLATGLIVKGHSFATSREFVMGSLSRLMVRRDLFANKKRVREKTSKRSMSKETPVAKVITRKLVKDNTQCYEVTWNVQATVTDSDGVDVDGYDFSTIEPQELIAKQYPDLVTSFREVCIERQKQGDAERAKRKEFVETLLNAECDEDSKSEDDEDKRPRKREGKKKRIHNSFFDNKPHVQHAIKRPRVHVGTTDEIKAMMGAVGGAKKQCDVEFDHSTIATGSLVFHLDKPAKIKKQYGRPKPRLYELQPLGMTITVFKPSIQSVQVTKKQISEDSNASVEILERPSKRTELVETHNARESKRWLDVSANVNDNRPEMELETKQPVRVNKKRQSAEEKVPDETLGRPSQQTEIVEIRSVDESKRLSSRSALLVAERLEACDKEKCSGIERNVGSERVAPIGGCQMSSNVSQRGPLNSFEAGMARSPISYARHEVIALSKTRPEEKRKKEHAKARCDTCPNVVAQHGTINQIGEPTNLRAVVTSVHQENTKLFAMRIDREMSDVQVGLHQADEAVTPVVRKIAPRQDPNAWMTRVIVENGTPSSCSIVDSRVNRRLEYSSVKSTSMPSLAVGLAQLIICDMGIPIPMTPLAPTKCK